jgi:DNA helicase-2/ATP-dependent DNA helicase PcrA
MAGDDDQAIYGWRGADLTRLHAFERTYPRGTVLAVGQNYRSTPQIVATAARLIGHNRARRVKPLAAVRPDLAGEGAKIGRPDGVQGDFRELGPRSIGGVRGG